MKYRRLHESVLGEYDYHGLPPKPGPESLAKLNCTFGELMTSNGLKALLDLCCAVHPALQRILYPLSTVKEWCLCCGWTSATTRHPFLI